MSVSPMCPRCGSPLLAGHAVCAGCTARMVLASGPAGEEAEEDAGLEPVGPYDLVEEIGRGAMGVVYRARDRRLGRSVALKVVLSGRFASSAERQRFMLEAEAAARLDHPHVVTVYESGEANGRPYFSMRLVAGKTLAERLREGPVDPVQAARWLKAIALGVQHAHERGVLHRDLKPGNVLIDASGEPHVADFGLARQMDREMSLTLAGGPLGTPAYMAPEAAEGSFSAASDVWSMGVMMYEMLAGRPPFADASLTGTLLAVRESEPTPLREVVPGLDRDLESVCLRCLEKDPARRYRSAAALGEDLDRWMAGAPVQARPISGAERLGRWVRRRPAVAALALTALLLLAGGASGIVWQWRRADREAGVARAAWRRSEEALWEANASRARALIASRAPGQQTEALTSLREAARHHPSAELRDLAVAALARPDLTLAPESASPVEIPFGTTVQAADPPLTRAMFKSGDAVTVIRLADGQVWARVVEPGLSEHGVSASAGLDRLAVSGAAGVRVLSLPESGELLVRPGAGRGRLDASGRLLVSVAADGGLEAHAVEGGRLLGQARWAAAVEGLSVSPDGTRVAVWSGTRLAVLRLPGFEGIADFENLPSGVMGVNFNPDDGTVLAGLDSTGLVQFDPATKSGRVVVRHDREGVQPLGHPGGLLAASTAWDGTTRLSAAGWGELLSMQSLRPLAFSSDGRRLLGVRDQRLRLAAVTPPEVWRPLNLGQMEARDAAFSRDSARLAVAYRTGLAVWDVATGRPVARLPLGETRTLAWQDDGSLWVALIDQGLGRFHFEPGPPPVLRGPEILLDGSHGRILSFVILPDNRVATNGDRLLVWRWPGKTPIRELTANPFSDLLRRSADGRRLAAGCWANNGRPGSFVGIWDPDQAEPVQRLPSGNADAFFSPDGSVCLVGEISAYREYDTRTWLPGRSWSRPSSGLEAARAAWSQDGRVLALHADESTLRLLDYANGRELARLATPVNRRIERFVFSPDGRWLAGISTGELHLWDLVTLRRRLAGLGLDWPSP